MTRQEFEQFLANIFPGAEITHIPDVECNETVYNHDTYHPVTKPEHYNKNGIEAWDAIKASMTKEEWEGYCKGNVIKYLWRYRYKNGAEDLEKGKAYLEQLIKSYSEKYARETQTSKKS